MKLKPQAIELTDIKILVVDDVESNRKMLKMLLKKCSVQSCVAVDGEDAISKITPDFETYKVIMMDNLMPKKNGPEAAKELRALGYRYLIIGVTGNVLDDDVKSYLKAGADLVLPKPVIMESLLKVIEYISLKGPLSQFPLKLDNSSKELKWIPLK